MRETMSVYRNDRSALRLRVDALRREVEQCEERVTAAFWRCIPDDDAEALRALLAEGEAYAGDDDASLTAACGALGQSLRRFERVLAELDRHESAWRAAPEAAVLRGDPFHGSAISLSPHADSPLEFVRAFLDAARALDRDARVEAYATPLDYTYAHSARVELTVDGAPVALQLFGEGRTDASGAVRELRATTTVPRGLPELVARPETWTESLFRGLRLRRDRAVGDARFDAFFHIECEPGAEAHVLTGEVRAALLRVASVDVPTLVVKPPLATLTWCYAPTAATVAAAARCVAAIRRAPVLPLLRPAGARR